MNKQHDRIKRYIDANGSITTNEAFVYLGVSRLAARISEMEQLGLIDVDHVRETGKNRFGEKCSYIRYIKCE